MALIKCPECGKEVSESALNCPNCGYQIKGPTQYEQKVETFRCFGFGAGKKSLNKKIEEFTSKGWEVVSVTDAPNALGLGFLYKVTFKREK